jgi:cation diffusion facilitator CzcD-associated flavoprotein CzcO
MKFSESRDANSHQEAEQRPRRIAIVGGGIAGLAAAYELEKLRRLRRATGLAGSSRPYIARAL